MYNLQRLVYSFCFTNFVECSIQIRLANLGDTVNITFFEALAY